MLPSLHDYYLASYEVNCEARVIKLHARHPDFAEGRGVHTITIAFSGIEGYHFKNDAFGNIVFSLRTVSVEELLLDYRSEITESYRIAGAPGPRAADLVTACELLAAKGVKGFVIASSFGLSGWVLAKEASVSPTERPRPEMTAR